MFLFVLRQAAVQQKEAKDRKRFVAAHSYQTSLRFNRRYKVGCSLSSVDTKRGKIFLMSYFSKLVSFSGIAIIFNLSATLSFSVK